MKSEQFVENIKLYVRDVAIKNLILQLEKPSGRKPRDRHVKQSQWYNKLADEDKEMLVSIITEAVDESIFDFFAVLDGVKVIDDDEKRLELRCISADGDILLNDSEEEYLHDIYNDLAGKE